VNIFFTITLDYKELGFGYLVRENDVSIALLSSYKLLFTKSYFYSCFHQGKGSPYQLPTFFLPKKVRNDQECLYLRDWLGLLCINNLGGDGAVMIVLFTSMISFAFSMISISIALSHVRILLKQIMIEYMWNVRKACMGSCMEDKTFHLVLALA